MMAMARKERPKRGGVKGKQAAPVWAVTVTSWDQGAQGPANRIGLVEDMRPHVDPDTGASSNPNGVKGVRRQTWLQRYLDSNKLTVAQFMAGCALQRAASGRLADDPLSALAIDKPSAPSDPQAAAFDARRHFRRMWDAVPNSARPVLERVVLDDQPVWCNGGVQMARHIERLQHGLDSLIAFCQRY